jgi:hypothetical protein
MSKRLELGVNASFVTALGMSATADMGRQLSQSEHLGSIATYGLGTVFGVAVIGIGVWGLKGALLPKTAPAVSPK